MNCIIRIFCAIVAEQCMGAYEINSLLIYEEKRREAKVKIKLKIIESKNHEKVSKKRDH